MAVPANAEFPISNATTGQIAMAIAGGYRAQFGSLTGAIENRRGVSVSATYDYLHGFHYEHSDIDVRLATDGSGMLTLPTGAAPLQLTRRYGSSGHGFALDLGATAVLSQLEMGFGVNGLANRITWTDVAERTFSLDNLFSGNSDFRSSPVVPIGNVEVTQPVTYSGHVTYRGPAWSGSGEVGRRFDAPWLRFGLSTTRGPFALSGAGDYSQGYWSPIGEVCYSFNRHVALDVAASTTRANIERAPRMALSASLRLSRSH